MGGKIPSPAGTLGQGQHSCFSNLPPSRQLKGSWETGQHWASRQGSQSHPRILIALKLGPHFSASSDLLGGAPDRGCPGLADLQLHPVP